MAPLNGSARKSQSYGTTPVVVRRSAGRSSWIVKYRTGYESPGAGAQTGPEARKAPTAAKSRASTDFPLAVAINPNPRPPRKAKKPPSRTPRAGNHEAPPAVLRPVHTK